MTLRKQLSHLVFIITLSFSKHRALYFAAVGGLLSICIEFAAIAMLSSATQSSVLSSSLDVSLSTDGVLLIFIFLMLGRFASLFVLEAAFVHYTKEMQVFFSSAALRKIVGENIKKIEQREIGHYTALAGDEASIASQVLFSTMNIINTGFLIVAYLTLILIFASEALAGLVVLLVAIALFIRPVYRKLFTLGHEQATARRETDSIFVDSLNSLRVVKAFSIGTYMTDEYRQVLDRYCTTTSHLNIYSLLVRYFPLAALMLFYAAMVLFLSSVDDSSALDIAFYITLLVMLLRLLQSIGALSGFFGKLTGELKGIDNIISFIKEQPEQLKNQHINGEIEQISLDGVAFSYGDKQLFDNLVFTFRKGRSYAIYGESGTGKSTLLDLIMDYITPSAGSITINGLSVSQINEESLTTKVIYVSQDSLIFNRSIRDNISLDKAFADDEIMKVTEAVCLRDLVEEKDEGLDHLLLYRGTNISGGQRQRINLARALIRQPDVLILDEATSALDPETKNTIINHLTEAYRDKILIFVTHDSSLFGMVDEVMDLQAL